MDAHELKSLQVRKNKLIPEIISKTNERDLLTKEIVSKKNELAAIEKRIENATLHDPVVTEHALLRYIERVMGIDLAEVTKRILSEQNKKAIKFAGNCKIKSEGIELIVKNKQVISVV